MIRDIYEKRTTNITHNGERLERSKETQKNRISPILFLIILEPSCRAIRQEKEIKGIQIGKNMTIFGYRAFKEWLSKHEAFRMGSNPI